jgi:hypothetical protein
VNAEITGEIPHIDGGQSAGHSDPCQPSDGGDSHPHGTPPPFPALSTALPGRSGCDRFSAATGLPDAAGPRSGRRGVAGAWWPEEDHVVLGGHEVEGAQVGDDLAFEGRLVVEIEVFQGPASGEAGGADAALAAVGLADGDLALQADDGLAQVGAFSARVR